ncbi:MAG TPA: hypothetical protein VF407_24220 [Polyangiaceae bacterium]
MDQERISRLEALLARIKAAAEKPRFDARAEESSTTEPTKTNGHANGEHVADTFEHDSIVPPESSTLHALPPPPPVSSTARFFVPEPEPAHVAEEQSLEPEPVLELDPLSDRPPPPAAPVPEISQVSVATRPAFMPANAQNAQKRADSWPVDSPEPPPAAASREQAVGVIPASANSAGSLEEAFESYEAGETVELTPDAEDDAVRPSAPPPVLLDSEFDPRAQEAELVPDAPAELEESEEFHSQQRLVVAPPSRVSTVDSGELEIVGEADLEEILDVDSEALLLDRASQEELDMMGSRPTREMSAILESGFDAPAENANRPVLELQEIDDDEEIEEPPPSSRRPVAHEEVHEAELQFDNDVPARPLTPPPESGPQIANEAQALEELHAHDARAAATQVADFVENDKPAPTFGDLLEDALDL